MTRRMTFSRTEQSNRNTQGVVSSVAAACREIIFVLSSGFAVV